MTGAATLAAEGALRIGTGLVTLLVPVTAFLTGAAFLGEALEPRNLAGLAFIALGLGLIDGRPLRYVQARLFARASS